MEYMSEYGFYKDLVTTGHQTIYTKDITESNIEDHFKNILSILDDAIEKEETNRMKIHIVFQDNVPVTLTIHDYLFNLMFWTLCTASGAPITSMEMVYFDNITKSQIKQYVDRVFVNRFRKTMEFMSLNQTIDGAIGKFRYLRNYQLYLANTVNIEDTIDLMKKYPEFNNTIHLDITGVPLEDVKEFGLKANDVQINYIKNSNHCLKDSFLTGEGINRKQFKEVQVNIGSKPDGQGTVFPTPIPTSFLNGGLNTITSLLEESSVGRVAQILQKRNVGKSGDFARKLGTNNQDTRLYPDPNYSCETKNLVPITISNSIKLKMCNMRYYRERRNGPEKLLDAQKDKHLIGKTLWFRSPITCASAAAGYGICYKCYGDLAYVNRDINIGQIASELLSSIYTQTLLSAKHLLESAIIKMEWTEGFFDIFELFANSISLKDGMNYHGMTIIFDKDNMYNDDEYDDMIYSDYTTSFVVRFPNGNEIEMKTSALDNIYISTEMMNAIAANSISDSNLVEIDMESLASIPTLFAIEIKNNELSNTMNKIKNLINNKSEIRKHTLDSLLNTFIDTNIAGNIVLNTVHFEVLIMNQCRSVDDIIEMPDWSKENEQCQILTLDDALANNRSVTVRLQHNNQQGMVKTLINPRLRDLRKPSVIDVYFMEQPQDFVVNRNHISDRYQTENDIEENKICPIYFTDTKGNRVNGDK